MAALPPNDPNNNPHKLNEIKSGKATVRFEAGGQTEKAARLQSAVHAARCGTPEPSVKFSLFQPSMRENFELAPGGDERRVHPGGNYHLGPGFFLGPGPYKN